MGINQGRPLIYFLTGWRVPQRLKLCLKGDTVLNVANKAQSSDTRHLRVHEAWKHCHFQLSRNTKSKHWLFRNYFLKQRFGSEFLLQQWKPGYNIRVSLYILCVLPYLCISETTVPHPLCILCTPSCTAEFGLGPTPAQKKKTEPL